MSETIQKGWITDENGQKFAPKTLIEQVQDNDGTPLQNYVDKMILTDEEDSATIPEVSNDISNDIVQFTSEDNDGSELYTDFSLSSGSKLSVLIQKATRIVNNVKYMIKLLGNTDISSIGDGTVTGAVNMLNTYSYSALTVANTDYFKDSGCFVCKVGNQVNIQIQINVIKGYTAWTDLLVTTIPSGYRPRRGLIKTVHSNDGFSGALRINSDGTVKLQSFNGLTGNFIFENLSYSI